MPSTIDPLLKKPIQFTSGDLLNLIAKGFGRCRAIGKIRISHISLDCGKKLLVSEDMTTAIVIARMETMGDMDARRDSILASLRDAVDAGVHVP